MIPPKRTTRVVQPPPAFGQADTGVPFDPASIVPEPSDAALANPPFDRAMPAPQSPLPKGEIERLKARAAKTRAGVSGAGQQDPGAKKPPK